MPNRKPESIWNVQLDITYKGCEEVARIQHLINAASAKRCAMVEQWLIANDADPERQIILVAKMEIGSDLNETLILVPGNELMSRNPGNIERLAATYPTLRLCVPIGAPELTTPSP